MDAAVAHSGRLAILVNNARIAPGDLAENVTVDDYDRTMAVNAVAPTLIHTPGASESIGGSPTGHNETELHRG